MLNNTAYIGSERCYVYAVLFQGDGDKGYIKIGFTGEIDKRLSDLRCSCPLPAKYFAVIEAGTRQGAKALERMLKFRFSQRRVTGEWYNFDFKSEEDKRDFNTGCRQVFKTYFKSETKQWWTKIPVDAFDALRNEEKNTRTSLKLKTAIRNSKKIGAH